LNADRAPQLKAIVGWLISCGGHVLTRSLVLLVLFLVGVKQCVCQTQDAGESPPEVTILKHGYSFERGFVSAVKPDSQSTHDEPVTKLWTKTVIVVTAKVRSNTTKKITGVTWYFVLKKSSDEEYFRIRFSSHTEIAGGKTKTLKGTLERWPRVPRRAVSVDELKVGPPAPPQERILISCMLFSDGSFSSLKDSPTEDCQGLVSGKRSKRSRELWQIFPLAPANKAFAADGAIACFSSNFFPSA
jgi:hypothetical protein